MKIKYCYVKLEYLLMVYDQKLISKAKYINRPFIYIPDLHIAIAIPELTNHDNFDSNFNLYINNNKNYLDVASMIYVDENKIIINKKLNDNSNAKTKLQELEKRYKELYDMIQIVNKLTDLSNDFRSNHMHIERSKKLIDK